LKKRSKKLLVLRVVASAGPTAPGAEYFCRWPHGGLLFIKKEPLAYVLLASNACRGFLRGASYVQI
jgi:hypothetical protein